MFIIEPSSKCCDGHWCSCLNSHQGISEFYPKLKKEIPAKSDTEKINR